MLAPIAYSVGIACGANPGSTGGLVSLLWLCMGMATPPASTPAAIVHSEREWIPGDAVKYGLVSAAASPWISYSGRDLPHSQAIWL